MGDGWLCRDIGARKKARWLKRVKYGLAETCVAKEEGDRWLSFSLRGSVERCRLLMVGLLSKAKGYVTMYIAGWFYGEGSVA